MRVLKNFSILVPLLACFLQGAATAPRKADTWESVQLPQGQLAIKDRAKS